MRAIKKYIRSQSRTDLVTLVVTVVVCALLGGGLAYAFVKKQAPKAEAPLVKTNFKIATWETYTSEQEGVSFKYPKDWVLTDSAGEVQIVEPYTIVDVNNPPLFGDIRAGVHRGDEDKHKFADWDYDRYFSYITSGGKSEGEDFTSPGTIDTENKQKIKVDGTDGYLVSYNIAESAFYGVFVKHGNAIYNVSITTTKAHEKELTKRYRPLLRKVISTFKFTK